MLQAVSSSRNRCSSGWPNLSSLLRRHLIVLLISTVYHVPFSFCQNYSPGDLAKVNTACRQCDDSAISMITQYNFLGALGGDQSTNLTSLDIGRQYCEKFSKIFACYQDCLQGYKITYTSYLKSAFENFYNQFCDTGCLLTFLPGCFAEAGVPYDLYRSGCDPNEPGLLDSISKCMNYYFDQQNCQGACTKGQRAASGLKLSLAITCGVPVWKYDCGVTLSQCMELSYGSYGTDFIARDSLINGVGSGSCSAYGKSFSSCIQQAVNGVVRFGNPPFTVDYYQPCSDYADLVSHLTSLSDSAVKPMCDNPQLNLSVICSPTFSAVTIVSDSSTTSTRASAFSADLQTLSSVAYRQSTDPATTSVSSSLNDTPESPSTANPANTPQSETGSSVSLTAVNNSANGFATSSSPATTVATPALSPSAPPATGATAETYYTAIVDTETTVDYPGTVTTTSGTPSTAGTVATPTASHAYPSATDAQASLSSVPPSSEPSATSDSPATTAVPATLSVPPALLSTLGAVVETVPSSHPPPIDTQTNANSLPASIVEGFTTTETRSLASLVSTQPTINASPPVSVVASASALPTSSYPVTNDATVLPPLEPVSTTSAEAPTLSPALPETHPSSFIYSQTLVAGGTTAAETASATPVDGKVTIAATTLDINENPTTIRSLPVVSSQISDAGVTSAPASGTGDGITPVTKAPSTKKPCKKRKR